MFCVVCSVRYSNPKLMHVGHQYMADNFDPKTFDGLLEFRAFHLAPDKGLGIFTFNNQENLKKHLSDIKKFNEDYIIKNGQRLFQLVHPSLKPISIEVVEELDETERGSGGFGSTGK